ncbi:serine/threonine protein kinase [Actinomadura sp. ATCC 31491]|uniref:Serine/threonine protein kinase n=1 Tax=Actinomadura luzonensis TaxID=2805427 RepID=A0ABT0FIT0_9ACTN|nr:serine/threonine-protein kinase [Actinomadura luzonensis]MCK2212207.1 serine/threonine protein kinase [Actinomadura luzonensis]
MNHGRTSHVGRYRLLSVLGRGGMGTVHLAEDPTGQRVAVKVINPELTQHEQFRMRFRREADAARRVRRFCTAAVLEAALDGDQLYVVTEYVPGPNLEQAVRASGPLRGSSLDALAVSVATALTAIHAAGVVHRDLKPSNVLLSPVGPRVIDFGIARALDTLGGVTGTGELVGTPRYMAPEVLRGEPVSPACDVFSWGCLVAFAASGRAPFGGDTLPAIVYQVLNTEPGLDDVEPGLRELVRAALRKDPAARPTAQQLLDHLVGRPAAGPEQVSRTVQATWQHADGPFAPATRPGPAGGARRAKLYAGLAGGAALLAAAGVAAWALLSPSGPPDLDVLYAEDFTQTSGGWNGTYDPDSSASYGYRTDGTYGLDVEHGGQEERRENAPVPFLVATPTTTPDPSAEPTPMLPASVVIGVTAEVKKASGAGEYGLYCHDTDDDDTYYEFALDTAGKARIRRVVDGAGGTLAQPVQVDGLPGKAARIVASCEQSGTAVRLTLWVNGERVHQVEDPNGIGSGTLGVFARTTKAEGSLLRTTFDDFELRGPKPNS